MSFVSPTSQYSSLEATWLASHRRPCLCDVGRPLDLRDEQDGIHCARCDRVWRRQS